MRNLMEEINDTINRQGENVNFVTQLKYGYER